MRSIAVALTWEFWRRSRWWIFSEIIVMVCVTTVLYGRISSLGAKTHAKIHYMTLFYEFICFAYFILPSFTEKTSAWVFLLICTSNPPGHGCWWGGKCFCQP